MPTDAATDAERAFDQRRHRRLQKEQKKTLGTQRLPEMIDSGDDRLLVKISLPKELANRRTVLSDGEGNSRRDVPAVHDDFARGDAG
jgi:hypothetical protein